MRLIAAGVLTTCRGDGRRLETVGARVLTRCDWHTWRASAREVQRTGRGDNSFVHPIAACVGTICRRGEPGALLVSCARHRGRGKLPWTRCPSHCRGRPAPIRFQGVRQPAGPWRTRSQSARWENHTVAQAGHRVLRAWRTSSWSSAYGPPEAAPLGSARRASSSPAPGTSPA